MGGQLLAALRDRLGQPCGELARPEPGAQGRCQPIPEFLPHLFMDSFVADDGKAPPRRDDEKEDAVLRVRRGHAEPGKRPAGGFFYVSPEKGGNRYADLARGARLGRLDGFLDAPAVDHLHQRPPFHGFLLFITRNRRPRRLRNDHRLRKNRRLLHRPGRPI